MLKIHTGGVWVAWSRKPPTHDFGSGHGPRVFRSSHTWGSVLEMEAA